MVGEASGRMQKADCRDEIALPAAMLAWLKYRKQRTRNSRKRFLVFFCSLFVKARVVYRLRDKYDFILIDCMPSLGMITLNALTAADEVIIPVQAQYLPAKGMTQLMKSISLVKSHTNENLKIAGIVMTLVDSRTNLAKDVIDTIRTNYGMAIKIFDAQIPIAVKAAEAAKNGQSIFAYDRCGKPAKAYGELVKEVIADAEREKQRDRASVTR